MKLKLVLFLFQFYANILFAQTSNYNITQFNVQDGLASNAVTNIIEDRDGFIWIATQSGLCRFDGYRFKIFQHHSTDSNSITASQVAHITLAKDGNIWTGLWGNAFDLYDQKLDRFVHYSLPVGSTSFLEDDNGNLWIGSYQYLWMLPKGADRCDSVPEAGHMAVASLYKDRSGIMWIGSGDRIVSYNPSNQQFKTYSTNLAAKTFCEDVEGNLWIGSFKGLGLFNPLTGSATWYQHNPDNIESLDANQVNCISEDQYENLWVGTTQGLLLFDKKLGRFLRLQHDDNNPFSFSNNHITAICEDRAGNLWVGTANAGVNMLKVHRYPFHHFQHQKGNSASISHNDVTTFCEGNDGNIWVGTRRGGLNLFDQDQQSFTYIPLPNHDMFVGMGILEDHDGYLWVSSKNELKRFHPFSRSGIHEYESYPIYPWFIFQDSKQEVWANSLYVQGRFQPDTNNPDQYIFRDKISTGLKEGHTNSTYEDSEHNIWICAPHGLYRYDRQKDHFNMQLDREIMMILDDHGGIFLLAIPGGLIEYDWKADTILNQFDFGPIVPIGAEMDNHGNLWLTSPNGLYHYNYKNQSVKKYDHTDGMNINRFNIWATMKSRSGELFFGGDNGFIYFHPDSLKQNTFIPPVVITDFLLANQLVPVRGSVGDTASFKSPLVNTINQTEHITLPYSQNMFSFRFSALDFTNSANNKYRYHLKGFMENWVETDALNRIATFTNLNPGEYIFTVTASNNDGAWNAIGKSINIIILPPWWMTWWAYGLYGITLLGIILLIFRELRRRDRLKIKLQIEQLEVRKMKELDEMKTQFFANISHEFRTPLTLILGPLKQMFEGIYKGDPNSIYEMMIRNGNRLLKLINQLLDFSKLEAGVIPLQAIETDIIAFSKMIFANFESVAEARNIRYFFQSDTSELLVYFDKKHLEKILLNLLSNAFKFTPDNGEIFLKIAKNKSDKIIDQGHGIVEIQVVDNGIGIDANKIPYIFDRYYQIDTNNNQIQEGTGIGLALVKELVKLHHGSVDVVSNKNIGTTLIVRMPLGNSHLTPEELAISISDHEPRNLIDSTLEKVSRAEQEPEEQDNKLALIVEDNSDMRKFISEGLEDEYKTIEAINGENGFEQAIREIPDIIISDVMMPKMDGYGLCQKLKTDERTSHIPIILLTAKADKKSKIEGLEIGADDYLTKPFNMEEMKIRAKNLIDQREKLRQRYGQDITLQPKDMAITSADEKFLKRAMKIIEDNIEDADFGAEQYSNEIGLSRSQLHRKLKALTDKSSNEFIRSYRLNYAHQLLEKEFGNIAEICYASGFNNPSYFAECFKKQFNVLPSELLKQKEGSS